MSPLPFPFFLRAYLFAAEVPHNRFRQNIESNLSCELLFVAYETIPVRQLVWTKLGAGKAPRGQPLLQERLANVEELSN
jgi:hypothetical protein